MKIVLVRHGQTNYNVMGLVNATPSDKCYLTGKGVDDAKKAAEILRNDVFDIIYTSELLRTMQTAEYINKYHNSRVLVDGRLNDIDTGLEDGGLAEIYDRKKELSDNVFTFRFGNGESSEDVLKRATNFLDDIKSRNEKNVLAVSSEHVIMMMLSVIDNIDPRIIMERRIGNGEVIRRVI